MQPGIHEALLKLAAAIICALVGYRLFEPLLAPRSRPVTGPPCGGASGGQPGRLVLEQA